MRKHVVLKLTDIHLNLSDRSLGIVHKNLDYLQIGPETVI